MFLDVSFVDLPTGEHSTSIILDRSTTTSVTACGVCEGEAAFDALQEHQRYEDHDDDDRGEDHRRPDFVAGFEDDLRLRAALTDIVLQRPGVESPGPLIPLANDILVQASEKVSGLNALEGEAAIEAELLDAQSHERLAAYVEKRAGSHVLLTKDKNSLGPILDLFSYWSKRLRQRLDEARGLREYQKEIQ